MKFFWENGWGTNKTYVAFPLIFAGLVAMLTFVAAIVDKQQFPWGLVVICLLSLAVTPLGWEVAKKLENDEKGRAFAFQRTQAQAEARRKNLPV